MCVRPSSVCGREFYALPINKEHAKDPPLSQALRNGLRHIRGSVSLSYRHAPPFQSLCLHHPRSSDSGQQLFAWVCSPQQNPPKLREHSFFILFYENLPTFTYDPQ